MQKALNEKTTKETKLGLDSLTHICISSILFQLSNTF